MMPPRINLCNYLCPIFCTDILICICIKNGSIEPANRLILPFYDLINSQVSSYDVMMLPSAILDTHMDIPGP